MLNLLFEALNRPPSRFASSDPVLKVLCSDPGEIIGRKYFGYLLFLFGSADEEFATWFARNISALDSLTGSDLAVVVLATHIRVKVQERHARGTRPNELEIARTPKPSRKPEEVVLSEIDRSRI